jgi:outer membrane protein
MFGRRVLLVLLVLVAEVAAAPKKDKIGDKDKEAAPKKTITLEKEIDELFVEDGLTADQAASRAPKVSPAVRRRVAELEAAIAQATAVKVLLVPDIRVRLSYNKLSHIDPVILPLGGMTFTIPFLDNSYLNEAQIGIPLSDYLLRFPPAISAANLGADAARDQRRASELSAAEDARLAYYDWVRAKLQVVISRRQVEQVKSTLDKVKAIADEQRLSKADVLRVESQHAQAQQLFDRLTDVAALREEQLRILIGAKKGDKLEVGEDVRGDFEDVESPGFEELDTRARTRRLELKAVDHALQSKRAQQSAERANRFPRISAVAQADYANPNPRYFPQQDTFKTTWSAGLLVTWSLDESLVSSATSTRLAAEAEQIAADRQSLRDAVHLEVMAADQAVSFAKRSLDTTRKGLTAAEENYRVRQALLAEKRVDVIELVDSETDLTRARIDALNAQVDLRIALARLSHAIGDDTARGSK